MAGPGPSIDLAASRGARRIVERPGLFERLASAKRAILVSAPAGSGKTSLLRSWIAAEGLGERTAWVTVEQEHNDPLLFCLSVQDALRATLDGARVIRGLSAAPGLESPALVNRLLEDLSSLERPLWLAIDDLHELQADDAIHQLELLLAGAPTYLRLVLLTRRDPRLGLHRLRLDGELTEIRFEDLRFTLEESRTLLETAGVHLSEDALGSLVEMTEGWVTGLRLAALSLARHPDPEGFATGFSGRDRAVAEYLVAEVLEQQPKEVSRLLLRTSVLRRVSGPLADRLTSGSGSERILWELEDAGAFVVAVDPDRRWFRYHRLFADLLELELRRTAPADPRRLHVAAAQWFSENGHPVEAVRRAQTAEDWTLAARLLFDSALALYVGGQRATVRELLSQFPPGMLTADAELAALAAGHNREGGPLEEADQYLIRATHLTPTVPDERRRRFYIHLAFVNLMLGRARNDLDAVAKAARRLVALIDGPDALELGLGEDVRTHALTELGIAEMWAGHLESAERHLESALAEVRRIDRPLREVRLLSHLAVLSTSRAPALAVEQARAAVDLAARHGWEETAEGAPAAYVVLGTVAAWRGELADAERWLARAERALRQFAQPTTELALYATRAIVEFALGRHAEAIAVHRHAERIEGLLVAPNFFARHAQANFLEMLALAGHAPEVQRVLDQMTEDLRETNQMRFVLAVLALAQNDPESAVAALMPIFERATATDPALWQTKVLVVDAMARDALGDPGAASRALERALDLAEPDGLILPFLLFASPHLLERHRRLHTAHAALITEILNCQSGHTRLARPPKAAPLAEPLTDAELRVLRYLPTHLQTPEIAAELVVSVTTIRTHIRHVYTKLGAHDRSEAVHCARALGLLAPPTGPRSTV